jgi:membrane-bound metal-dependent hydrolase YbcI (DUF457 family)
LDNVTHTLFAFTLANAGLRRPGRGATAALVVASNIPDVEIVRTFTGGRVAYLEAHRGATHGPAALLLAAATAGIVWLALRRSEPQADRASFASLLAVASAGVLGHVAMDFATSYGTRVLSPFNAAWYGVDWMPIIDVLLLAILAGGIMAARLASGHAAPGLQERTRASIAAAVLLLAAADYTARAVLHAQAMSKAVQLERASPGGSDVRGRPPTVFRYLGDATRATLPAALPTDGSPFEWRIIITAQGGYAVAEVNVLDNEAGWLQRAARTAVWFPNDKGPFVGRAAAARLGRVFLGFSRFPAAEIVTHANGDLTVHWYDLRYAEHRVPVGNDRRRHTSPFGAWVRLTPDGNVVAQGLGPG